MHTDVISTCNKTCCLIDKVMFTPIGVTMLLFRPFTAGCHFSSGSGVKEMSLITSAYETESDADRPPA